MTQKTNDVKTGADGDVAIADLFGGMPSGSSLTATDWQEIDRLANDGREDLAWLIRSGQVSASDAKIRWDAEADEANGWHSLGGDEKDQLLFPNVEDTRRMGASPFC